MTYREKMLKEGNKVYNLLHADRADRFTYITSVTKKVGKKQMTLDKRKFL